MNHPSQKPVIHHIALLSYSGIWWLECFFQPNTLGAARVVGGFRKIWARVWTKCCQITTLRRCDCVYLSLFGGSRKTQGTAMPKRGITPIVLAEELGDGK